MFPISNRFLVCVPPLVLLALQMAALTAPPAGSNENTTLAATAKPQGMADGADRGDADAVASGTNSATTDDGLLKTPVMVVPEPVVPAVQDTEKPMLNAQVARLQAPRPDAGSTPPMAADVPSLMAPFGAISDFSLGHTVPGSKWRIFPHVGVSAIFDDNIYLDSSNKVSDVYFAISPGIGASYGADESPLKIRADYTASFLAFVDHSSQDTVDQDAALRVSYEMSKLTLGLTLGFQSLSGADIDVGDRVRRQIYYAGLTANYVLDEKFSVDVNADETVADYKDLNDSNESRLQAWLNYQATGKLKLGVGLLGGYLGVQESPTQTYEQFLLRAHYDATGKLVLYASGGVEVQQSDTTTVSPVFSIGGAYSPFARTTITLEIHERVYGSAALDGQDYRATGIMVGVNQELRENLSVFLNVGFENASYYAVASGVNASRVDNYTYARIGPSWQVRQWCQVSSFYEFSNNASSGDGSRPFTRDRVGIQANFAF